MQINLTDEQLNIAICEWRGWTRRVGSIDWLNKIGIRVGAHQLPSHITGIEALGNMHEAEKGLTYENHIRFGQKLAQICGDDFYEYKTHWSRDAVSATARQRAIALLRVVRPNLFTT